MRPRTLVCTAALASVRGAAANPLRRAMQGTDDVMMRPVFLFVAGLEGSGHHGVQSALLGCGQPCAAHAPLSRAAYQLRRPNCSQPCARDVVAQFRGFLEEPAARPRVVPINCGGSLPSQMSYPDGRSDSAR